MSKVSTTSTKNEILAAYEEILEQIKAERKESSSLRQELEKKQGLLERASAVTKSGATLNLQQIRTALGTQLDELEAGLGEEQKKYEALQQGAAALQHELQDLHKIKAEAESLEALVIANRQAREKLEREMETRRLELETAIQATKSGWTREQEAYDYDLKLKRRNEQDAYNERKAKMEKELAEKKAEFDKSIGERERAVAEQEEELKRLRKEAETFEQKLQKAVQEAEKSATAQLTREFEYQQKIQVKDLEAELRLREQMIKSLEEKVKEQQEMNQSLSAKTDNASQQVKDIALKAIEKSGMVSVPMERRRDDKNSD